MVAPLFASLSSPSRLTHVLTNALKRFKEYARRALHPSIITALSKDVRAYAADSSGRHRAGSAYYNVCFSDIHESRVYLDDIEQTFPNLVCGLTTKNIIRQIFVVRALCDCTCRPSANETAAST